MTDSRNPPEPIREVAKAIMIADHCGLTLDSGERVRCDDERVKSIEGGRAYYSKCDCLAAAVATITRLRELGMFHPDALAAIKAEEAKERKE